MKKPRLTALILLIFCIATPFICIAEQEDKGDRDSTRAATDSLKNEEISFKEDFKHLVPIFVAEKEIERMKSSGFPVENIKKMVLPKNWRASTWGMPHDLTLTASGDGLHISTKKTVQIFPSFIRNEFADFFLDATIRGGSAASTISVSVARSSMLHVEERQLQKFEIAAGERREIRLPVKFDFVNTGFYIFLEISGDVTLQNMLLRGRPLDLSGKGFSCMEGTLAACSAIPDPKKSDYPDCRFTCHFIGKHITAGCPCPQELQLVLEGFRNYRLLGTKNLKAGDKVRCLVLPYEKLPENLKSTQQADDLDLISLDSYYVAKIEKIEEFSTAGVIPFTRTEGKYISVFERNFNPPVSAELDKMQREAIAADLAKIDAILAGWDQEKIRRTNEAFQKAWAAEKAKDKPGHNRVKVNGKTFVWRSVDNSFWGLPEEHVFSYGYHPLNPKNVEALAAFRDFLHANGCQFIVSLVPYLYDISARVINPDFRNIPDFRSAFTARELLKNGIETIYPSDELIRNYNRSPLAFSYPYDTHPFDTCQDVAAELVAKKIKRYGFAQDLDPGKFSTVPVDNWNKTNKSLWWPSACDIGNNQPGTPYLCHRVLYDGKVIRPVSKSPILVIGNSFIQTPTPMPEAFPPLLASKLHMGISAKRVNAEGPLLVIPHNMMNDPEGYLKGRKVVVLHIGAMHLHTSLKFNNIREMDRISKQMDGRGFLQLVPIRGNTSREFDFAKELYHPRKFSIHESGGCLISSFELQNGDMSKEKILIIPVCVKPFSKVELFVNGQSIPVEECVSPYYYWCKSFARIPAGEKSIAVELKGKPGSEVAIGDIQVYQ